MLEILQQEASSKPGRLDPRLKSQVCADVSIKAVTGNAKSLKTVLTHPEKYHVASAVKLGQYNVDRTGSILTLPLYMGCLLSER